MARAIWGSSRLLLPNSTAPMEGLILLLGLAIWLGATYSRFAKLRQLIRQSWVDIDVELKRRHELIPNLVSTAEGYVTNERELFTRVSELLDQSAARHASAASQAEDESDLMHEMRGLFAVVEGYPELKANAQFLTLQAQLAETEDRLAAASGLFNGKVRAMNLLREGFPSGIVGSMFGFGANSLFELDMTAQRIIPRSVPLSSSDP
ncbi:MAG: LemA family protein [Vicinamibacterales bacterium]|nr:LemA family protein [Vicinamibacterales bacterium]